MNLRKSFFSLLVALFLSAPLFAQSGFGPAPADIKGLVGRHFSAISTADATKFKADMLGDNRWVNDTLLYFKRNLNLSPQTMQYKAGSGGGVVLIKMKGSVDQRMSYDLLRSSQMQATLRKQGLNPNQYMAFKVKQVGKQAKIVGLK